MQRSSWPPRLQAAVVAVLGAIPAEDRAVLEAANLGWQVHDVLPNKPALADAGPDGLVRLTEKLLDYDDLTIKAAVAHELAHIRARHPDLVARRPGLIHVVEVVADELVGEWLGPEYRAALARLRGH